jgi:diguanylate cyclase (GGDEF)-like protein/PAS domain S-box-containing protein
VLRVQEIVIDIVVLGLLVFLFAAVAWVRPDNRLRCWVAGWLCVLVHFGFELWQPVTAAWRSVQACAVVDALALAGILFVVSTMILTEGRGSALRLWVAITIPTLVCLSLAAAGYASIWPLSIAIVARQMVAIFMAARARRNRPVVTSFVTVVCVIAGVCSLYGVQHGHPDVIIVALLAELYLVTAINFWNNGGQRTVALHTMAAGMVAWAAVFPLGYFFQQLWPQLSIDNDLWNTPEMCVAIGMILAVIEEQMRAARALGKEYRLLFDGNPRPMWILDAETLQFLDVNQAGLNQHGYTHEEFLQLKLPDILDPGMVDDAARQVAWPVPSPNRASRHVRKDGTVVPMDITAHSIDFRGRNCRFVMALDVTERETLAQRLIDQAQHDALTGLSNRLLFREQLTGAVQQLAGADEKLAILCLDIHRFKRINDVYGPRVGDECIQRIAGLLRSRVQALDILARTGGDEFTIVLTGIGSAAAAEQAAKELQELLTQPLEVKDYRIQLSVSMGLAVCPDDGTDADALWRSAESAVRRAQAAGGGQIVWLSPELRKAAEKQVEIEAYMREALHDGDYHLAYQPLYGFDGQVHGLEALLRLDHPKYGAVSPADFIPIAEEMGLIVPLGQWVIEQTCRQLLLWQSQGMRMVPVAVNLSVLQLVRVDFAGRLMKTLNQYGIDPKWIHLEVTETAAMLNLDEVSGQMAALSSLGIAFSLDDFGTGHSSLGRLHQLRLSELKIDRSFIKDLGPQTGTYSIVQAILSMAHSLGHEVVAEGVETASQLDCLRELHCDLLQGFLLSRPVQPELIPILTSTSHPAFGSSSSIKCSPALVFPGHAEITLKAG